MDITSAGRLAFAAVSGIFLFAATQSVSAHEPGKEGGAHSNLQILPADIPQDQLMGIMKNFAQSLGVRCTHCHVGEEGQPLSTFDFASDDKQAKKTARTMMKMTVMMNKHHFQAEAPADYKVTCYTCHRGSTKPMTAPPPPPSS